MKSNEQYGKFTGPAEVRLVRTLPGPIERIWDYLTDPVKRARWFAGGPMELRAGGKMRLDFRHKNIAPDETPTEDHKEHHDPGRSMAGIVTRCEPPRLLAFTFGSEGESEATFELTPQGKNV
ncbi:MAG TPA: SRPBCC domain-containing protein, partial [Opitutaceae bacterium]|nr:SRPBCC domain-containing protein [Opitutaceae bacterium]